MRSLLAWALYWTGDVACRLSDLFGAAYQKLMNLAHEVQGQGRGPWQ